MASMTKAPTRQIKVTSFSQFGEERAREINLPAMYGGQQNISLDGWEITLNEDGSLTVERSTVAHSDVALKVTQDSMDGDTYIVTLRPYEPSAY